jgi:hypothetical protein
LIFLRSVQWNLVGRLQVGEDGLAISAGYEMFFQRVQLFGQQRPLVISRQGFRIRTSSALGSECAGDFRRLTGSRGGTQMTRKRFVKTPIAFVRRHRLLHP